jgi:hypothetical protein
LTDSTSNPNVVPLELRFTQKNAKSLFYPQYPTLSSPVVEQGQDRHDTALKYIGKREERESVQAKYHREIVRVSNMVKNIPQLDSTFLLLLLLLLIQLLLSPPSSFFVVLCFN